MKINPLLPLLFFLIWMCSVFSLPVYAEEPVPGAVLVNDTELYSRLDTMQQTIDGIAAALSDDSTATPETATDYTAQLDKIESALTKIEQNTTPATPETPVPVFEKPFEEYTTAEVLLLCIGVVIVLASVGLVFLRR